MFREEKQISTQVADVSPDASVSSDLLVNNLVYKMPSALSLATSRSYMRHFPQVQTYSAGQTMVFDLTSGSSYVDAENSYLTFRVQLVSAAGNISANFGSGSAMNLIRQITIRSRSGTELDRLELCNVWSRIDSTNTLSDAYLSRQGLMEGWGLFREGVSDGAILSNVTNARFVIPLARLSHLFKPEHKGQKLPPQLMSGLHIEVIWEDVRTAVFLKTGAAGDFAGYVVSNIAIVTDSITMTDDVQKTINMESATNGLEVCYNRIFTSQMAMPLGATSANVSVRKAVSQAKLAYTVCLDKTKLFDVTADSFKSLPFDVTTWQYRLGSLYFPKEAIQCDGTQIDSVESYLNQVQTFNVLKHTHDEGSVSFTNFKGGSALLAASFERDQELELSALPVNNSRTVELDVQFEAVSSATLTRQLITFLQYCGVARTFIDNVSSSI
jgi:hypothetical protein